MGRGIEEDPLALATRLRHLLAGDGHPRAVRVGVVTGRKTLHYVTGVAPGQEPGAPLRIDAAGQVSGGGLEHVDPGRTAPGEVGGIHRLPDRLRRPLRTLLRARARTLIRTGAPGGGGPVHRFG
ncbi:hypothetical protein ACFFX0_06040 [Citricoccus parietis]|uniref:Creatinase N-terminal domain-containing protein n=1 Tax=Citricoccus parietis TaxID=592307 RepID=A0ABV5FVS0_9MICC